VAELGALAFERGPAWPSGDLPSTYGLLDQLQIDAAGLIADDEFPNAAEDLFQDADMKKTFGDLLAPRPTVDEAELRRAKDRVSELTVQLELLYKRVAELESGQTNLVHRLAEKEMLLRRQPPPPPPPSVEAFLRQVAQPPVAAPAPEVPPFEASAAPPLFAAEAPASQALAPVWPGAEAEPLPPAPATEEAPKKPLFERKAFKPASGPPAAEPSGAEAAPPVPAPEAKPKESLFARKTFKVAQTVKSFRVVGPNEIAPLVPETGFAPTSSFVPEPVVPEPPPPAPVPVPQHVPPPAPEPLAIPAAASIPAAAAPISLQAAQTPPPAFPAAAPPLATEAAAAQAGGPPTPMPAPPVTLSFGGMPQPAAPSPAMPSFSGPSGDAAGAPPATAIFAGGAEAAAPPPSTQEVLARLAKPASSSPATAARPPRSNKKFLFAVGGLVVVMGLIGFFMLRHPKDLKQMTELDDGRSRVGTEAVEDASRPPMVKPKPFTPPAAPAPAEAPQAASQAKLDAAVAMVKDFPLDGERGTVGRWLQYSYTATQDAGKESWSASETADKTYLVEYRFTPSGANAVDKHYLFEADTDRGFVIGKNLDAKNVLSGVLRGDDAKTKPAAKAKSRKPSRAKPAKRAARRPVEDAQPKEVPLLPLPNEGELRPPAEDDGAFRSDTVNSGM
jgi:hypothetical protein